MSNGVGSADSRVELAVAAHADVVSGLFQRADCPCYCQYYGFVGDHRDWQNRCANDRAENRRGLERDLEGGGLLGFVAFEGETAVGWLRLAPPRDLAKTYSGRLYRGLPCFDGDRSGVLAIACFLIEPAARRRGVAARLLDFAIAHARTLDVTALEALPRGARDVSDEEQWTGPLTLYERAGFGVVRDFAPYPVLRLALRE